MSQHIAIPAYPDHYFIVCESNAGGLRALLYKRLPDQGTQWIGSYKIENEDNDELAAHFENTIDELRTYDRMAEREKRLNAY